MKIKETEAALLVETGMPLQLARIQLPNELQKNQVLIELITSGVCGSQLNEIDAVKGPDKFLPHLLGHEGFGTVMQVGPGVTKVTTGDCVVMHWRPSSGVQSTVPNYGWNGMKVNAGWVTTFNRHAVVSENRISKISSNSDPSFSPLLGCCLLTALGVVKNEAKVTAKDQVLITGLGGVGNAILQFCRSFGVENITVVELDEKKRALGEYGGATNFVLFDTKQRTMIELRKIFEKMKRPSVAFETTGNVSCIEIAYESTADFARIVLVGVPKLGEKVSIYTLPLHLGKTLAGTKGGSSNPESDITEILKMIETGLIDREKFPTVDYDFAQVNKALDDLRKGMPARPILKFA